MEQITFTLYNEEIDGRRKEYILIPIYSEELNENDDYSIIDYRKEYI